MVEVKSGNGNQTYTRIYLQGSVADGFPKTETSSPPNKNSGKNHYKKSLKTKSSKYEVFHYTKNKTEQQINNNQNKKLLMSSKIQ